MTVLFLLRCLWSVSWPCILEVSLPLSQCENLLIHCGIQKKESPAVTPLKCLSVLSVCCLSQRYITVNCENELERCLGGLMGIQLNLFLQQALTLSTVSLSRSSFISFIRCMFCSHSKSCIIHEFALLLGIHMEIHNIHEVRHC